MPCSQPNWKGQKQKEKDLELNTKQNIKNYLSCIVVKNADGKTLKQLDKLCLTCFEFGKREGRDDMIKEIDRKFEKHEFYDNVFCISKEEWEAFKHGKHR